MVPVKVTGTSAFKLRIVAGIGGMIALSTAPTWPLKGHVGCPFALATAAPRAGLVAWDWLLHPSKTCVVTSAYKPRLMLTRW